MLPGLDGHLVSAVFLERQSDPSVGGAGLDQRRRRLIEWRITCRTLGPASTPMAMLQTSAAPLTGALGFDAPVRIERLESAVAATLGAAATPVAIIVTSWAAPLDPLWRLAVTQAMRRSAVWCLLFDGLR